MYTTGKRKIGLYGGSFNPIHVGHITLAKRLMEVAGLDEVWMMVSPQNPFKANDTLLADDLRLAMTRKALEGETHIVACDCEFHLPKPSYTWNTLQALGRDCPDCEFTLLIGGDNWQAFDRWFRGEDIVDRYRVVVYPRRGAEVDAAMLPPHVQLVDTPLVNVSSTEIRRRVAAGESIRGMVPEAIEADVLKYYVR
ncbi:nicotinate (nicotinamide) nucleotide adenylyltransferase [Segatella buccae]|uniref:nicotinate (nicotinamide) nucleotide adenylyltransferase n=1 Tax=Segatella buccae TaxID=28126 RepID=UPI00248E75E4|nr:nicotinate (nicotinamide) nucleotide adenylyltransferase [Segatella buccae]